MNPNYIFNRWFKLREDIINIEGEIEELKGSLYSISGISYEGTSRTKKHGMREGVLLTKIERIQGLEMQLANYFLEGLELELKIPFMTITKRQKEVILKARELKVLNYNEKQLFSKGKQKLIYELGKVNFNVYNK